MDVRQLAERLFRSGLCTPSQLVGCTEANIKRIEKRAGCKLPERYKELLRVMGKSAGEFNSDVTMYYPAIVELTEEAKEQVRELGGELPDGIFVFADRDGEQILFFHVGTPDQDPPIYRWYEEEPEQITRVCDSVWDFIAEQLDVHEGK